MNMLLWPRAVSTRPPDIPTTPVSCNVAVATPVTASTASATPVTCSTS